MNEMKVTKYIDKKQWLILPLIGIDLKYNDKSIVIAWLCIALSIKLNKK